MPTPTNLLHRDHAMLLVIDVQDRINSAMVHQGHLPRIEALIEASTGLGVPVVVTEQYPKGLGPTVRSLQDRIDAPPVVKETFSCAREPAARTAVESSQRHQVVVTGIEAHVCVLQTVLDLLEAGLEVHVPHDAVNSRREADKGWALHRMAAAGAVITSTESALFELLERCGTEDFRTVSRIIKGIPVDS